MLYNENWCRTTDFCLYGKFEAFIYLYSGLFYVKDFVRSEFSHLLVVW